MKPGESLGMYNFLYIHASEYLEIQAEVDRLYLRSIKTEK
jgi:hypothetical protein